MSKQITFILKFFMARNLRIARERVWAQTVESRGKGPEFWKPYVEEWKNPPYVPEDQGTFKFFQTKVGRFMMQMGIRSMYASPLIGHTWRINGSFYIDSRSRVVWNLPAYRHPDFRLAKRA